MIGSSELLLTMGALIIFGLYAMQANRNIVTTDTWAIENEIQLEAAKIGESIIKRAASLPFDEKVVDDPITTDSNGRPTNLTNLATCDLGSLPIGQRPTVRFFEDFNCHKYSEQGIFGEYTISTRVQFVNDNGIEVTTPEFRKIMHVEIEHQFLNRPVRMQYTKSYH